jgi:hypothetical protein
MCNISQSCDQTFYVNCGPQSEVIVSGTPKQVIQEKTKAHAHAPMDVLERGTASIHLDVQSMINVEMSKSSLGDGDGLRQQAGVAVDLALFPSW